MDWKDYEKKVYQALVDTYSKAKVSYDVKLIGRFSKVARQCDMLIEEFVAGNKIITLVDTKYLNRRVDVKIVESFIGMLGDLDIKKGMLITNKGYSEAAINLAYHGPSLIEVDIFNLDELLHYQGLAAIPFSGKNGIFLTAPMGWIIDNQNRRNIALAFLYQRGLSYKEAWEKKEIAYINFWNRKKNNESIESLLRLQEFNLISKFHDISINYPETIIREGQKTALRIANTDHYQLPEITGFVEFDDFIFFIVMFSPIELSAKNTRKIENIMTSVIPITINQFANKK